MLDLMRRKKQLKIILWVVIFGLALGMLLFFVPGVNIGNVATDTSAAKVAGQSIPFKDFIRTYRRIVERYNRSDNRMDPETLKAMGLPRQVLDDLIASKVVHVVANRFGIEVTSEEVRREVETHPLLQDNQGNFIGIERYKMLLARNGYTVTEFENELRLLRLTEKLNLIIADSLKVSDQELRDEFAQENQKTVVDYVLLKKEDQKKAIKPTEAELRTYFDGHKDAYRIKEKRRARYLLVPTSAILPEIEVTEQEIREEWKQNPRKETVEAAHILFSVTDPAKDAEVRAKAQEVLKQIQAGGDFAALAQKHSEDIGSAERGGYLGPLQRGQMVQAQEFEDAAFSLKPGEVSDLVRTDFGYHIIKVLSHETPTLEENREGLKSDLKIKKAQDWARRKAEEAARLAENQKDLHLIVTDLGIAAEVKETGLFTIDDNPHELGISQEFRDEVFALKELQSIGKAISHPMGYAVPKLIEVQMPKPGDFNQSRTEIEKDYIDFKAGEMVQAEAKTLSGQAAEQGSLAKAARKHNLEIKTSQEFTVTGTPDPEIGTNSSFNRAAFELQPGEVSAPQPLRDNWAVFQVKSRTPFDEAAFQEEKEELRSQMLQSMRQSYFQEYIRSITEELEKDGKIRINTRALEQASLY
jgi:peptidyl-prolyl cis-trans isomerase D